MDVVGNGNTLDQLLEVPEFFPGDNLLELGWGSGGGMLGDGNLLVPVRIIHSDEEHETVELGFGEGIGSLLLDRVLGGEHEEGFLELVIGPGHGHPLFLHRLEQGGLSLGGSPVDFVGEDYVGEDGALDENEFASFSILAVLQDFRARDAGGHEVGGELNPPEGQRGSLCDGVDQKSLGQSRDTHQEGVSLREHAEKHPFDGFLLTDDYFAQLGLDVAVGLPEFVYGLDARLWRGIPPWASCSVIWLLSPFDCGWLGLVQTRLDSGRWFPFWV